MKKKDLRVFAVGALFLSGTWLLIPSYLRELSSIDARASDTDGHPMAPWGLKNEGVCNYLVAGVLDREGVVGGGDGRGLREACRRPSFAAERSRYDDWFVGLLRSLPNAAWMVCWFDLPSTWQVTWSIPLLCRWKRTPAVHALELMLSIFSEGRGPRGIERQITRVQLANLSAT